MPSKIEGMAASSASGYEANDIDSRRANPGSPHSSKRGSLSIASHGVLRRIARCAAATAPVEDTRASRGRASRRHPPTLNTRQTEWTTRVICVIGIASHLFRCGWNCTRTMNRGRRMENRGSPCHACGARHVGALAALASPCPPSQAKGGFKRASGDFRHPALQRYPSHASALTQVRVHSHRIARYWIRIGCSAQGSTLPSRP